MEAGGVHYPITPQFFTLHSLAAEQKANVVTSVATQFGSLRARQHAFRGRRRSKFGHIRLLPTLPLSILPARFHYSFHQIEMLIFAAQAANGRRFFRLAFLLHFRRNSLHRLIVTLGSPARQSSSILPCSTVFSAPPYFPPSVRAMTCLESAALLAIDATAKLSRVDKWLRRDLSRLFPRRR